MKVERKSFVRFAVAVALACYDLPADRAMTSDEAARLVKWVIDMALGPAASDVLVEPMAELSLLREDAADHQRGRRPAAPVLVLPSAALRGDV